MLWRKTALVLIALCAAANLSCGYALAGRGSYLPDYIKIIAIPAFVNRTPVFNLETTLTEKVRSEFISRGRYKIQPTEDGADAVLTGEVVAVTITSAAVTADQIASRYTIRMTISAQLRDVRENKPLWENRGLSFTEEYEANNAQTALDPSAFFGQNSNALERMTTEFSRSIVTSILEAF